jgi:hypothetical protein
MKSKHITEIIFELVGVSWSYWYEHFENLFMQEGADAGMSGTPSLYPSIFVNSRCGKNDHMASPVNNDWCGVSYT